MTHPDDEMGCWHPEPPPYDLDETRRIGRALIFGVGFAAVIWAAILSLWVLA